MVIRQSGKLYSNNSVLNQYQFLKSFMGTCCALENSSAYKLSANGPFTLYQRNPTMAQNAFYIYFEFQEYLPTCETLGSQSQKSEQSLTQVDCYKIKLSKCHSMLETTKLDIGTYIQKAFQKANRFGANKVIFMEPKCQPNRSLNMLFDSIVMQLISFDQANKYSQTKKVYINWPSIDCKQNIDNTIRFLRAI